MECGVCGGKFTVITSSTLRLLVILIFVLARAPLLYVFVSIEQLTRSRLGPMECMESSGKRMSSKEGQILLIRASEFVNKVSTCSWRREAGKRREEKGADVVLHM